MTQFKLKADLIELASYEEKVEFIQERLVVNYGGWWDISTDKLATIVKEEFGIELTNKQFLDDVLTDKIIKDITTNFMSSLFEEQPCSTTKL